MANFSIYRDTNILRPRFPFGSLLNRDYGNNIDSFSKFLYFGATDVSAGTYGGILYYYTGATWNKATLRTYNGSWINKPLYVYKAGSWQLVDKN